MRPAPTTNDLEQALVELRPPGTDRIPLEHVSDRFRIHPSDVESLLRSAVDAGRVAWDSERETYSSLDAALDRLRESLLFGPPLGLRPDQGDRAFQEHKLLASAVHRASRLDQRRSENETNTWVRFMSEHFPPGRNDPEDARLLFDEWRVPLLKDGTPGPGVLIAHGQSFLHWERDAGRLCINLEDMWTDFEHAVDHFTDYLRARADRRPVALKRARERTWDIVRVTTSVMPVTGATAIGSASVGRRQ